MISLLGPPGGIILIWSKTSLMSTFISGGPISSSDVKKKRKVKKKKTDRIEVTILNKTQPFKSMKIF